MWCIMHFIVVNQNCNDVTKKVSISGGHIFKKTQWKLTTPTHTHTHTHSFVELICSIWDSDRQISLSLSESHDSFSSNGTVLANLGQVITFAVVIFAVEGNRENYNPASYLAPAVHGMHMSNVFDNNHAFSITSKESRVFVKTRNLLLEPDSLFIWSKCW